MKPQSFLWEKQGLGCGCWPAHVPFINACQVSKAHKSEENIGQGNGPCCGALVYRTPSAQAMPLSTEFLPYSSINLHLGDQSDMITESNSLNMSWYDFRGLALQTFVIKITDSNLRSTESGRGQKTMHIVLVLSAPQV